MFIHIFRTAETHQTRIQSNFTKTPKQMNDLSFLRNNPRHNNSNARFTNSEVKTKFVMTTLEKLYTTFISNFFKVRYNFCKVISNFARMKIYVPMIVQCIHNCMYHIVLYYILNHIIFVIVCTNIILDIG